MERDFELEYKKLKQSETPDLWDRIEAGLSEKKVATLPLEKESQDAYLERLTVKKQTSWKRWGILAAACLCIVIVFPAVMISLTDSSKSGSSADTALYEESADGFAGSMESTSDMGAADEAAAAESEDVLPDSVPLEVTDGQILEDVMIQISAVNHAGEQDIYMATVRESDADRILTEEMQICIICDAGSEYGFPRGTRDETALKAGESYTVTLRYEEAYEQDESVDNGENPVFYALIVNVVG